ncbi:MAG: hypothetical protein A2X39_04935 [Elusimicrobia bacterium GWC2_56_31]|nr:MAG: hypothetical protein A2X39_04935 [Elusimicrobia bacterium GWC2_56_31]
MKKYADLILINPGNRLEQFAKLSDLATIAQPLGIAMLAAFVREQGYSVAVIDAEAEFLTPEQTVNALSEYETPLLIGLSAFTTKMTAAAKVLRLVKENFPACKTMIGGHHCSAIPEDTLKDENIDFVIKGEGYYPVCKLLESLKKKSGNYDIKGLWYREKDKVVGHGRADGVADLDKLPFAAWDLLPMDKYRAHHWQTWDYDLDQKGFAVFYTSLGCPFNCEYCSVNVVYGSHKTRYRSPAHVVKELKMMIDRYKIRHVEIIDDTFTINPSRVDGICDEIIKNKLGEKLNMWCFARTNTVSPRIMEKMKRAGINWVFMGLESGDDEVLQSVEKKQNLVQIYKAVEIVHKAGLHIGGNYVFGLPTDTMPTMHKTLALAKELNTEYANFFIAMAYPGTRLHEMAKAKGYELPEQWGQYGFFAPDSLPLRNEHLSAAEILKFRDTAFEEYYASPRYQKMLSETFGGHILDFLKTKVLSKKIVRTRY